MPHSTFFRFMGPSLLAMILFIALPIISIVVQSLYIEHPQGCCHVWMAPGSASVDLRA